MRRFYGESERPAFKNLERHHRSLDTPELPHVIFLEASGKQSRREDLKSVSEDYDWAIQA
jgi:hypothetical protein